MPGGRPQTLQSCICSHAGPPASQGSPGVRKITARESPVTLGTAHRSFHSERMPIAGKKPDPITDGKSVSAIDLARILGLSHATISFVLNGKAEKNKISRATIERVKAAAQEYNYIPNQLARNLRNSRSGMIGVILGNFRMDWAEAAVGGMQTVFDDTDYVPFVATHGFDAERNRKEILSSLYRRDEGIIALPMPGCEDIYAKIIRSGVPLIFLGDEMPDFAGANSVVWDCEAAADAGVRHLVDIGRKRIAFLGVDYPATCTQRRFEAYRQVLQSCGLPFREQWVARPPASSSPEEIVRRALDQILADRKHFPDAIFALNDGLALPTLTALESRGIGVPGEIAVVGMGDLPLSSHPAISLTTVQEPTWEMGREAATLLLELIAGKVAAPVQRSISSTELLVRRSSVA